MQTARDTTHIVRSWLEDGRTALPDHVLDAVLDQLPATRQRRSPWPARRFAEMNNFAKLASAIAAVAVVAVVGYNLLPSAAEPGGGGPAATPSPTPNPTASPTVAPEPSGDVQPPAGALEPGTRYAVSRGDVAFTFAVPASGWVSDGSFWFDGHAGSPERTMLWFFTNQFLYSLSGGGTPGIFTDPCTHEGLRQFEDSIAGEAEAIVSVPGVEVVRAPSDATVGERPAKSVVVVVPEDIACPNSEFWLAHDPACGATIECSYYPSFLGAPRRYWIVDVNGTPLSILAESEFPNEGPTLQPELEQIVASIVFE